MSLLDNMPHECTIRRKRRTRGELGGSSEGYTVEQTGVECWEQPGKASESVKFAKRGMELMSSVYFNTNVAVTSRHQILITKRNGTDVSSPVALDVLAKPEPDDSAGMEVLWRVDCGRLTSTED